MAQKIVLKRSSVQGKVPSTTDLDLGEIALNTYDGKLFIKKNDGTESIVEVGSGSGGELIKDGAGYRINGLSSDTLGTNAVNLSSGGYATGDYSHTEGFYTTSQNNYMHAAGKYNVGTATDTIHETGIGSSDTDKKNAFEIYTDGKVVAPELTTTLIDDANTTNKVLVTKEWVQVNTINSISRTVEKLVGDGTTTSFTLSNTYTIGYETLVDVYVDGLLKIEGSTEDYTLSNGDTLDFTTAPSNGSTIIVKILS